MSCEPLAARPKRRYLSPKPDARTYISMTHIGLALR